MHKQRIIIIVIAALGMLATFLPWAKAPFVGSVDGTNGDGWITLGLFAVALVMSLLGNRTQKIETKKMYVASIASIIAAAVGIWDIIDIKSRINDIGGLFSNSFSVGYGLYLIVLAGLAIPVYLFIDRKKKNTDNKPPLENKPDAQV